MRIDCEISDAAADSYAIIQANNPQLPMADIVEQCIMLAGLIASMVDDAHCNVVVSGPDYEGRLVRSHTGMIVPEGYTIRDR